MEFALKARPVRRYIPKHRLQYRVWWFVTSQPFEYFIFVLILCNTITLAMGFHNQPDEYTEALDVLNLIFSSAFAVECVLKLMAFRFKVGGRICKRCGVRMDGLVLEVYSANVECNYERCVTEISTGDVETIEV